MNWVTAGELIVAAGGDPRMGYFSTKVQMVHRRARAEMLRARASVYRLNGNESRDVDLPRDFWPEQAAQFLLADWGAGDFEWWDGLNHREAVGVQFSREDAEKTGVVFATEAAQHPVTGGTRANPRAGAPLADTVNAEQHGSAALRPWCEARYTEGIGREKAWKLMKNEKANGRFTHVSREMLRRIYTDLDPNARPGPRTTA